MSDDARLSRLLYLAAREIAQWAAALEGFDEDTTYQRSLIGEIHAYRKDRGWSPDGYGGER